MRDYIWALKDPWLGLATAIVQRAMRDASGDVAAHEGDKVVVTEEAKDFIEDGYLFGLISEVVGIDHEVARKRVLNKVGTHNK